MNYNLFKKLVESSDKEFVVDPKIKKKSLYSLLLKIKGLNKSSILNIFSIFGLNLKTRVGDLNRDDYKNINFILKDFFFIQKDVDLFVSLRKKNYIELKHYKGSRYRNGLPVNGQRTKTNSKTCKKFVFKKF